MIKKTITYKNEFDGTEKTDDFYFHLRKSTISKLELSKKGGLSGYLQAIVEAEDNETLMVEFDKILSKAYGVRTETGGFRQNDEVWQEFVECGAYDVLFMELITNAQYGAEFIKHMVPDDLAAEMPDDLSEVTVGSLEAAKAPRQPQDHLQKERPKVPLSELQAGAQPTPMAAPEAPPAEPIS